MLCRSGLLDEAHTTVDLDPDRGHGNPDVGAPGLGNGSEQCNSASGVFPCRLVGVTVGVFGGRSRVVQQGPARLDVGLHRHQHPADVGMVDDGRSLGLRCTHRSALVPLLGIRQRKLIRALCDAEPL